MSTLTKRNFYGEFQWPVGERVIYLRAWNDIPAHTAAVVVQTTDAADNVFRQRLWNCHVVVEDALDRLNRLDRFSWRTVPAEYLMPPYRVHESFDEVINQAPRRQWVLAIRHNGAACLTRYEMPNGRVFLRHYRHRQGGPVGQMDQQ